MNVIARFYMDEIIGDISFYQPERGANVEITVDLQNLDRFYPQSFSWSIREYPVPYGMFDFFPCADLGAVYAPIPCPANTSQNCVYGNLGERLGPILSTEINRTQTFSDSVLDLYGPNTPIGRSIVIERETVLACANIDYTGISLQTLRAGFNSPALHGEVILRRQNGRPGMTFSVEFYPGCDGIDLGANLSWSLNRGNCEDVGPVSVANNVHIYWPFKHHFSALA